MAGIGPRIGPESAVDAPNGCGACTGHPGPARNAVEALATSARRPAIGGTADMTTNDPAVCACPCAAELTHGGPSGMFRSEPCQRRWYLHRLRLPLPAPLELDAEAKTTVDPWADVMPAPAG